MSRLILSATLALGLAAAAAAGTAIAQAPAAPAAPAPTAQISANSSAATSGTYKLDANHASVIARLTHGGGASVSTLRFGVKEGSLVFNPAAVEASKLNVVVDMTPRFDPITYGQDLKGPNFLDLAQFPTATFVSTGVTKTGATTGTIAGNLTFRGQTKPVTIAASLVGAGKTGRGVPVVGFTGVMKIKRSDFGFTFQAASIGNDVELQLDGEFTIPPPPAPPAA